MRHNLGKDKGFRQVTVMNEKSQGGSAGLVDGTIELVQNRRTLHDDVHGVGEVLNETSPVRGYGLKVNSRYYLQIFDSLATDQKSKSVQRQQQLIIDQPLQYMFAKKVSYLMTENEQRDYALNDELCDTCKIVFIPEGKNEFLMRVENIQDRFDV